MQWGREIEVNGVRPTWLRDDDRFEVKWHTCLPGNCWHRGSIDTHTMSIRLPANHWAYQALAAGFEPWPGGDAAPDDWDGGEVLLRHGGIVKSTNWRHGADLPGGHRYDVIGYRKQKPTDTVTLKLECDTANAVVIRKMTADEFRERHDPNESAWTLAKRLNLIREETRAERFTRETGHAVTPAVEAALEFDR